jgi:hypothetical protein
MRVLFLFCLLGFSFVETQAQTPSPDPVSNIIVRYRSIEDPNIPLPSINDPAYNNRTVEMEISFTLSNPDSISTVNIQSGSQQLTSDISSATITCGKDGNGYYFMYNGKRHAIKNNIVVLTQTVPEQSIRKSSYLSVNTTDYKSIKSKTFTKKVN